MGHGKFNTKVEDAFLEGKSAKYGNSQTDGKILLLFGNRIAEHREDGLYITNCGYFTNTTKNHLNVLPGVSISQRQRLWYLNDKIWDGKWIKVKDQQPPIVQGKTKPVFDTSTHWVNSGGYRGYNEPLYAVCGANNTGESSDSPCPTSVCKSELKAAGKALEGIPQKLIATESSNVFCSHVYIIVPPDRIAEAREKFATYFEGVRSETRLLYAVN